MRRLVALAFAVVLLAIPATAPAAASSITFETPTAAAAFGEEIVFAQEFTTGVALARVEILLDFPGSIGPHATVVEGGLPAGRRALEYRLVVGKDGHVNPNTVITSRWRLVPADRALEPVVGPEVSIRYEDTRFAWRTLKGDIVRVHWYEGSTAFGRGALAIGEDAVREAAQFMGVTESEPIDFFIYADEDAFYDAMGPGARENVVGTALSETRTMLALIAPDDVTDAEVRRVVPHELTHLVFDTAVGNPYHFPPRWLNEGVATYLSEGYTPSSRAAVERGAREDGLMPLQALGGQFPTTYERFALAYDESVSAVDYLVREKGTDALVDLITSYANGVTDDEAFAAAVGADLPGFESAWLEDLGAQQPTQLGPQPAPAGPLPPGWEAGAPATAAPGASATPPSAAPGASAGPGSGDPADDDASPFRGGWVLLVAALAGLLVGGGVAHVRRRRARGEPDGAAR